jgi:hypothetical protein
LLPGVYKGKGNRELLLEDLTIFFHVEVYGSVILDDEGSENSRNFIVINNTTPNTTVTINFQNIIFKNWKESVILTDSLGKLDLIMTNSAFINNNAASGACIQSSETTLYLNNTIFFNSTTDNEGGALFLSSGKNYFLKKDILFSMKKFNFLKKGSINAQNLNFTLNKARVGGAVSTAGPTQFINCIFMNNTADYGGFF